MSGVSIRRATKHDIPAMAELWAMLILSEDPASRPDKAGWADLQGQFMGLDLYYAFVVETGGRVVGFNNGLISRDLATGAPYVEGGHFFVLPEHRGGRAGALLHRMSFRVGKEHGCAFLRRKVHAGNERMMRRILAKGCTVREYIVDEVIR